MAGNLTFNFSTGLLTETKTSVEEIRAELQQTFNNIKSGISELQSNVISSEISSYISKITANVDSIEAKINNSFEKMVVFLENQYKNYSTTYQASANKLSSISARINGGN